MCRISEDLALSLEPVPVTTKDEVGEMGKSFNAMGEQINEIVANFQKMTLSLRHMARSAQTLSSPAEQITATPFPGLFLQTGTIRRE